MLWRQSNRVRWLNRITRQIQISNGFPQNTSKFKVQGRGSPNSHGHLYHSFANLFHFQIFSPNGLISFLPWMSAQTWKRVPFHGIFSPPLPPPLCLHTHTHSPVWSTVYWRFVARTETVYFTTTQKLNIDLDVLLKAVLGYPAPSFLPSWLPCYNNVLFRSKDKLFTPFVVLPFIKPSVQGLGFFFQAC